MNKIEELYNKLIEAKEAYYNDEQIMEDDEFDQLEDKLRSLDPENDYFSIVGIPDQGEKIIHKYPMLSAGKTKTVKEVEEWLNKILDKRVDLIIEPKIDGFSCTIIYENGKLQYIATRGDGKEGRIVAHLKNYLNVPKTIPVNCRFEVRGECYLKQNTEFPNPENKPLRNLAVGLSNRKDTGLEDLKYLNFVAYQFIEDSESSIDKEHVKIDYLSTIGFKVVSYKLIKSISELDDYFEIYKSNLRNTWEYETDGLMVIVEDNNLYEEIDSKYTVDHHHHYNIALKPPAESKWTKVTGINWQISKNGYMIPVVTIEPIIIGGSTIKNVTANNYENVSNLKINVGDEILVEKANEIIPFIKEYKATKDMSELTPTNCPSCDSFLIEEGVHLKCTNDNCNEKKIQIITYWLKNLEVEEMAEATIRTLYDNRFISSILDLYELKNKKEQLLELEGFGEKKITKMLEEIEKSKNINIVQFISSLSISLVGKKAVKKLEISSIDDFWNFNDKTYKIGQNLIEYREKNKDFIETLISFLHISDNKNNVAKGKICMTGSGPRGRKELIGEIKNKGYEFVDSITKDTNILICEDTSGNSGKLQKARKLGIKLINYNEFFN